MENFTCRGYPTRLWIYPNRFRYFGGTISECLTNPNEFEGRQCTVFQLAGMVRVNSDEYGGKIRNLLRLRDERRLQKMGDGSAR